MKATTSSRLPSWSCRRGNVWEKDVKCELAVLVYKRNHAWTNGGVDDNDAVLVGINLANYDGCSSGWSLKRRGKCIKSTIKVCSSPCWFFWIHTRLTVCLFCACLPLLLASPVFDETPGSEGLHFSNLFLFFFSPFFHILFHLFDWQIGNNFVLGDHPCSLTWIMSMPSLDVINWQ